MDFSKLQAEWHPTLNLPLVFKEDLLRNNRYWWIGEECGHVWDASMASRRIGSGCPICANQRILAGYNDLASTNPAIAAEWHPTKNGRLAPEQIAPGSTKKTWWLGKCGHEWEAAPRTRTTSKCGHEWEASPNYRKKGSGACPICIKQKLLIGENDLLTVNPLLANEWHPIKNRELTAAQIHTESGKKVWWLGACGHSWATSPAFRARGRSCPLC